jgi:hypothetical protein
MWKQDHRTSDFHSRLSSLLLEIFENLPDEVWDVYLRKKILSKALFPLKTEPVSVCETKSNWQRAQTPICNYALTFIFFLTIALPAKAKPERTNGFQCVIS